MRSYAFTVGDDVYTKPAKAAWRAFYYQRADCEKPAKLAGEWSHGPAFRGPGQAAEAKEYRWDGRSRHFEPVDPSGTRVADPTPRDVTGGWWDGGSDFGKHVGNTTTAHNMLLLGVQLMGPRLKDPQLDLPESGNGVPDVLDEIRYATEFLIRMGDATGACFGRAYEKASARPDAETAGVQLSARTSGATMNRACALAYAAVVWEQLAPGDPFARRCLDEATKSWELLRKKPHPWPADPKDPAAPARTGEWYSADYDATRALAAACLYRLTGKDEHHAVVRESLSKLPTDLGPGELADWWPVLHVYGETKGADATLAKQARASVVTGADKAVKQTGATRGYAAGLRGYWLGSNRQVAECGVNCLLAAHWTEDAPARRRYLEAAEEYVHYLFGRNPLGKCYLTNLKEFGAEDPVMVLHHAWLGPAAAGNPPPPGFLVPGPNGGMTRFSTSADDEPWAHIEPNIAYQAPAAVLIGYFGF